MTAKKIWWYLKDVNDCRGVLTCEEDRKESEEAIGRRVVASFEARSREAAEIICNVLDGWIPDAEQLLQELAEYWDYELKKKPR